LRISIATYYKLIALIQLMGLDVIVNLILYCDTVRTKFAVF